MKSKSPLPRAARLRAFTRAARISALLGLALVCFLASRSTAHSAVPIAAQEQPALPEPAPAAPRPNVVIFVIDDMSWEDMSLVPMPKVAALVERGRLYSQFYVQPVCSPSRYGLQFGRYGVREGFLAALSPFQKTQKGASVERVCVADVMHAAGYETTIFGKWHLSTLNEFPTIEGPNSLCNAARDFGYEHWLAGWATNLGEEGQDDQYIWRRCDDGVRSDVVGYSADVVTASFLEWWQKPADRPRFAVVNYFTPHEPFSLPPSDDLPADFTPSAEPGPRPRYEAAIVALDTLIARAVDAIDLSNTYVFIFPDNGAPRETRPPDGQSRGYKHTVWQGGVNVPLIVLGPGVEVGRSEHLTHIVDVPRTVFELTGAVPTSGFEDSRSFAASLSGKMPPREPVLMNYERNSRGSVEMWAVVDSDGWKLVETGQTRLLFQVKTDPWEKTPVHNKERALALAAIRAAYPTKPVTEPVPVPPAKEPPK